jgi:hypothetical protein
MSEGPLVSHHRRLSVRPGASRLSVSDSYRRRVSGLPVAASTAPPQQRCLFSRVGKPREARSISSLLTSIRSVALTPTLLPVAPMLNTAVPATIHRQPRALTTT